MKYKDIQRGESWRVWCYSCKYYSQDEITDFNVVAPCSHRLVKKETLVFNWCILWEEHSVPNYGRKVTQRELAEASGVTEVTVRNRYKDLKQNFRVKVMKRGKNRKVQKSVETVSK